MSPRKKPTTPRVARSIYLPKKLNDTLTSEAERRGLSANDLVILALEQLFIGVTPPATPDDVAGFD